MTGGHEVNILLNIIKDEIKTYEKCHNIHDHTYCCLASILQEFYAACPEAAQREFKRVQTQPETSQEQED